MENTRTINSSKPIEIPVKVLKEGLAAAAVMLDVVDKPQYSMEGLFPVRFYLFFVLPCQRIRSYLIDGGYSKREVSVILDDIFDLPTTLMTFKCRYPSLEVIKWPIEDELKKNKYGLSLMMCKAVTTGRYRVIEKEEEEKVGNCFTGMIFKTRNVVVLSFSNDESSWEIRGDMQDVTDMFFEAYRNLIVGSEQLTTVLKLKT